MAWHLQNARLVVNDKRTRRLANDLSGLLETRCVRSAGAGCSLDYPDICPGDGE